MSAQHERGVYFALYLAISLILAFHCYLHPSLSVDLLAYAGNVALSDTNDVVKVHELVYRESLPPHLRGADSDDLRRRATDAYYSAAYLPYFSVKPLYVLSMIAVHRAGANLVDSSRIVSVASFLAVAVVLWLYTGSILSLLILLLPEVLPLGQLNDPDGMSAFLVLLALWAIVRQKRFGVLPLLLSVWVRPETAILCVLLAGVLVFLQQMDFRTGLVTVFAAVLSFVLISHFGYGWKSLYFHTFLGGEATAVPHFDVRDYVRAVGAGAREVIHSSVPIFVVLWLASFRNSAYEMRLLLAVSALYSLVRFAIFPSFEYRYYALFFLVTGIAAVCLISRPSARAMNISVDDSKQTLTLRSAGQ